MLASGSEVMSPQSFSNWVGNLIPVSDRMNALCRQIPAIVACLTLAGRPVQQRLACAVADLLLSRFKLLLLQLLPGELQIDHGRDESQTDRAPGRKQQLAGKAIARLAVEQVRDG